MAVVSKSFTAVGDSDTLPLRESMERVDIAISGTYAATIQLIRGKAGGNAWEVLRTWRVANATVAYSYVTTKWNEQLRLRCSAFTSGTVDTTLTDEDKVQYELRDALGEIWATLTQGKFTVRRVTELLSLTSPLVLGATSLTEAELAVLDGVTPGTALASKALVLDANGDVLMPATGKVLLSAGTFAAAGTGAADAVVITKQIAVVTGANDLAGAALPAAAAGIDIRVVNDSTSANLLVYPINGGNDNINGLATGLPFILGPGKGAWFAAVSATQWYVPEVAGQAGRLFTAAAASAALTNTAAETIFSTGTATIRLNTLKAGSRIKIKFQGIVTAVAAADTLKADLRINGLAGVSLIAIPATVVLANNVFYGEYELIVRTIGAGGTVVGVGTFKSIPAAEGTMTIKDDILASTALDTTANVTIDVSGKWSAAAAGNSCRLDFFRVEVD